METAIAIELRHAGIVVSDIDNALKFYRDLLGLEIVTDVIEGGPYLEVLVGLVGAQARIVKLRAQGGGMIELLQYLSHPEARVDEVRSSAIGCSHVAFTVSDLSALYGRLLSKGYPCNSAPQITPDGAAKVVYCHSTDGTLIELVEPF